MWVSGSLALWRASALSITRGIYQFELTENTTNNSQSWFQVFRNLICEILESSEPNIWTKEGQILPKERPKKLPLSKFGLFLLKRSVSACNLIFLTTLVYIILCAMLSMFVNIRDVLSTLAMPSVRPHYFMICMCAQWVWLAWTCPVPTTQWSVLPNFGQKLWGLFSLLTIQIIYWC